MPYKKINSRLDFEYINLWIKLLLNEKINLPSCINPIIWFYCLQ